MDNVSISKMISDLVYKLPLRRDRQQDVTFYTDQQRPHRAWEVLEMVSDPIYETIRAQFLSDFEEIENLLRQLKEKDLAAFECVVSENPETDEMFLTIPDEIMRQTGWVPGDVLVWETDGSTAWLRKK